MEIGISLLERAHEFVQDLSSQIAVLCTDACILHVSNLKDHLIKSFLLFAFPDFFIVVFDAAILALLLKYIENLRLTYKYFKSCRNCCAHGDVNFTEAAETNYKAINTLTKTDCGLKEFPKIEPTVQGKPFILYLRGVVGFYDILIRIINHFDLLASDYVSVENELLKRWSQIPNIKLSANKEKRNRSLRNYIISVNMCPPYAKNADDVYLFLKGKNAIK